MHVLLVGRCRSGARETHRAARDAARSEPVGALVLVGRVGDRYVLFGALSRDAHVADVAKDVAVLSDNALDALDAFSEFLR